MPEPRLAASVEVGSQVMLFGVDTRPAQGGEQPCLSARPWPLQSFLPRLHILYGRQSRFYAWPRRPIRDGLQICCQLRPTCFQRVQLARSWASAEQWVRSVAQRSEEHTSELQSLR